MGEDGGMSPQGRHLRKTQRSLRKVVKRELASDFGKSATLHTQVHQILVS